jgi:putative transposase
MPRLARSVFAGVPHHIIQRGNRREQVFFTDEDRQTYLAWLNTYAEKHEVDILAYCLMSNHIHLVAVPATEQALQRMLRPLHTRYAQRLNRDKGWTGHVWQGRYFAAPLDEAYTWAAIRYVERNPVRARIVRKTERYPWSSAAAHCGLKKDTILTNKPQWRRQLNQFRNWSRWLAQGEEPEQLDTLRRHVHKGLPCGSKTFIRKLERLTDRVLSYRAQGRPRSG